MSLLLSRQSFPSPNSDHTRIRVTGVLDGRTVFHEKLVDDLALYTTTAAMRKKYMEEQFEELTQRVLMELGYDGAPTKS